MNAPSPPAKKAVAMRGARLRAKSDETSRLVRTLPIARPRPDAGTGTAERR